MKFCTSSFIFSSSVRYLQWLRVRVSAVPLLQSKAEASLKCFRAESVFLVLHYLCERGVSI